MLFSKKPKDQLDLILDIQSSIVRGSLVLMRPASLPVIISTYSIEIPYKPRIDGKYLIKTTIDAIAHIAEMVKNELRTDSRATGRAHHISNIHFVLSSPWIISQAKVLSYTYPKPTEVKKSHVLETIAKERSNLDVGQAKLKIIEEKICNVKLNGYSVDEWDNKETRQFDVSFVSSVADEAVVDRFEHACKTLGHRPRFAFHSSLLLQFIGVQHAMPHLAEYLLVHVHGELTDVVAVSGHACTFFGSFPFGTHSLVRKLTKSVNIDKHAAESMLVLYGGSHLDTVHNRKVSSTLEELVHEWGKDLGKILRESGMEPTVEGIHISAKEHEDLFKKGLKNVYPRNRIEILTIDDLKKHVVFQPTAEKLRLSGLYAIAINSLES